nr:hypothetical protein [Flavobacterium sp. ASV13]
MCKNTVEDYYKRAVKKRYEEVKNGVNFNFLNSPTRGKLRTLCWELFEKQNMHSDDLVVFNSLLGFPFDLNTKNNFRKHSNEFRPIETFLKGKTDPLNIEVVDMAAILVDFPLRPFNKFRIQNLYSDEIENDIIKNSVVSNPERQQIEGSLTLDKFLDEKEKERGIEKGLVKESEQGKEKRRYSEVIEKPKAIHLFIAAIKEKIFNDLKKRIKITAIWVAITLCIGFVTIYEFFPRKGCMQWTGDHYEIVDCSLKAPDNNIELLDPNVVNLKKIKVCDTTVFFKNEKAIVWYTKAGNKVEFFNTHGLHPENGKSLKAITPYIIDKYVKKH